MQITDRIENCNGCSACILGCKEAAIKMVDFDGKKFPVINEGLCSKCNNCVLYCPLYLPVSLPEFEDFYEHDESYYLRDMPKVYRKTMREVKEDKETVFVGTLCQIAGLKSVMGDRLSDKLIIKPLYCDPDKPKRKECIGCQFIKNQK